MKCALLFVCIAAVLCGGYARQAINIVDDSATDTLQAIEQRINQTGAISQYSLGSSNVWKYLLEALLVGEEVYTEMELYNIHFSYTDNNGNLELMISGSTDIWNQTQVGVSFVLYMASGLELALQFDINATAIPMQLWPANNAAWFSGLNLVGINTAAFSTSSFTDNLGNNFYQGLSIKANLQTNEKLPIQDSLYTLIHGPNTQNRVPITGVLLAEFPLSFGQGFTKWTLTVDGTIYFEASNVETNDLVINFQITSSGADITLNCDMTIVNFGGKGTQPVTFAINSAVTTSSGFTFDGTLVGTWSMPFGLSWMTFNALNVDFQFNPVAVPTIANLQFSGGMSLNWTGLAKPIQVNFAGDLSNNVQQIMVVAQVPVIDIAQIFDSTLNGQKPPMIDELTVSGTVNFALSTYNGQYQEGFTIQGNVLLSQTGNIANAVRAVNKYPESWDYAFQLYVPIFSQNPQDIDFYLTETGAIFLSPSVAMEGYHIEFDMTPEDKVSLSTTVDYNNTATNIIEFIVSGIITENNAETTLQLSGQMEGTWNHPFGLKWLGLQNVEISMTLSNGLLTQFSFQGTANFTFSNSLSGSVTIIIPGPMFEEFSFTVQVAIGNLAQFLGSVSNPSKVPSSTKDVYVLGSLTVCNYAHSPYEAGLTLNGQAMVTPGSTLAKTMQTFNPNSPLSFTLSLVLPIFSETPWDVSFSFTEQGTYVWSPTITVYSFEVAFQISASPSASISVDTTVALHKNPNPFHIVFSAAVGGSVLVSLSGSIQGAWHPYNLDWITATSTTAVLNLSGGQIAALGFSGDCNITYIGNTVFDFALETSEDFADSYLEIKAVSIADLGDFIKFITGVAPPAFLNDVVTVTNDFGFILSSYNTGNIVEGLTLYDHVTITGSLVKELAAFNQNNQVSSSTYGMGLTVPVFPGQTPNFALYLSSPMSWYITKSIELTEATINIDSTPPTLAISGDLAVNFTHNPQILFDVYGNIAADGTASVGGGMIGTWENMFGIKGVNLSDAEILLGFNPSMCAVDLCISAFGLGYNLTIGSTVVAFYGKVDIPDFLDIFLDGQITGSSGTALSFRDIAQEWNNLVGNSIGLPIKVSKIPADWGFMNTEFYIAPEAGTFNNIQYQQGFWIYGGIIMFGMEVTVDIKVSTDDFAFDVHITKDTFQSLLQGAVGDSSGLKVVSVQNVTLSKLSMWNYGNGVSPLFELDYSFLGGNHKAKIDVDVITLADTFENFYKTYLSSLFG